MKICRYAMLRFGKKAYVSIFALLAAAAVIFADTSSGTLAVLSAIITHEAGHLLALRLVGASVKRVLIYPFGVDISSDIERVGYAKEILVNLSGAAANLTAAAVCMLYTAVSGEPALVFFMLCNVFFFITNLIPIRSLDGGKALENLLCMRFPLDKALQTSAAVSYFSYFILGAFSLIILYVSECNISLTAYIMLSAFLAEKLI